MNKKRYISLIILLTILCTTLMPALNVFAHNIGNREYTKNIEDIKVDYPDLYKKLKDLKTKYPNWNFKIFNTGWNWDNFIDFQEENPKRSLIESYGGKRRGNAWIDQNYKNRPFDTNVEAKRWLKASREAIEYFVDPRTYLNKEDIFALYSQSYQDNIPDDQMLKGVKELLKNTRFASEAKTVVRICKEQNIDAIDMSARLKQENGPMQNPLNFGMSGNGTQNVIAAGLEYAEKNGWVNFETGFRGGVQKIKKGYFDSGQITKHSQKFNYVNENKTRQYMQNVEAPMSEGAMQKNAFSKIDPELKRFNYTFVIPIFSKMPDKQSQSPDYLESKKVEKLKPGEKRVEIIENSGIRTRTEPNTLSSSLGGRTLPKGTILILEEEVKNHNNMNKTFIWYKARLLNGTSCYIAIGFRNTSERWVKILEEKPAEANKPIQEPKEQKTEEIKFKERKYHGKVNAKVTVDKGISLKFRNLPDTKKGLVLLKCVTGKEIRVISKVTLDKPNGNNWYRVEVDGREAFCARGEESDPYFTFTSKNILFEDEYIAKKEEPKKPEKPAPKPVEPKTPEKPVVKPTEKPETKPAENIKINEEIKKGKFKKPVKIKVIADLGLNVRNKPGVKNTEIVAQLIRGSEVEIIESMGTIDNKDLWFKINDEREKYISKGKIGDESYFDILEKIEYVTEEKPVTPKKPENKPVEKPKEKPETKPAPKPTEKTKDALGNSEKFKKLEYKGEKKLSVIYNAKIEDVKALGDVKVLRKNGQNVNKENLTITDIATGNKIYIDGVEYTIIRKGDINGDGLIDEKDALEVFRMRMGYKYSTLKKAAARLSVEEDYEDTINSNINIQNTKEFKILLNKILK